MSLADQINNDFLEAYKAKDEKTSSVLRMLKSAIQNLKIAKKEDLKDEDVVALVQKEIKSRQESAALYKQGGREELAQNEEKEIEVLKKYLPEQMPEEEIRAKVKDAITKTGASSPQDMGKVMGVLMPEVRGKADGTLVSNIVKEELNK